MKFSKKPRIIYNDDTCTLRTAPPPHTLDSILKKKGTRMQPKTKKTALDASKMI